MRYAKHILLGVLSLSLFLSLAGCQTTSGPARKFSEMASGAWVKVLEADDWVKENLW
jgi:hypothetical protein